MSTAINKLQTVLMHPYAWLPERRAAADCAVCALLKIYTIYRDQLGVDEVKSKVSELINKWLPLTEDEQEAHVAHDLIMGLIDEQSPLIDLQDKSTVLKLSEIFVLLSTTSELVSEVSRESGRISRLVALLQKASSSS